MKIIKYIVLTLLIILSFSIFSLPVDGFDVDAPSAILIEAETGQVLFEKNADEEMAPASITKIMALLIAMEEIENGNISFEDEVRISRLASSMGGSQIFLDYDTSVKMEDLLKAVTIASANDATVAISEAIGGTYSRFIELMNERAVQLGMENTLFQNSTGLPEENHYTSARDITKMSRKIVNYDIILEWGSIWLDYIDLPRNRQAMLVNTNRLINSYPGMDGIKTGHTNEAGYCLAATAERNNIRLISVVLNTGSKEERREITARLLDYGFNNFNQHKLTEKGEKIYNVQVPEGKNLTTVGEASEELLVMVRRGRTDDIDTKIEIKEDLKAPVQKGEILGRQVVIENGNIINSIDIIATEDVPRANIFLRLWRKFVNWIGSIITSIT